MKDRRFAIIESITSKELKFAIGECFEIIFFPIRLSETLTTKLAYISGLYFKAYTHLQTGMLFSIERSVNAHVPFFSRASISSIIATFNFIWDRASDKYDDMVFDDIRYIKAQYAGDNKW